jgi:hypothetical protein
METKKPKKVYEHGEYIPLIWDSFAEFYAVKGHVTLAEFNKARECYTGTVDEHEKTEHIYGRWSVQSGEDGPESTLELYEFPGAGRFPVTATWRMEWSRKSCLSTKPAPTRKAKEAVS